MLKRVFTMLMVVMLFAANNVSASNIDISTLSDDELGKFRASIEAEWLKRGLETFILAGQGDYVVGKSIEPGAYYFYCTKSNVKYEGSIKIFGGNKRLVNYISPLNRDDLSYIYAEDSMKIRIEYCQGYLIRVDDNVPVSQK